MYVKLFSMAFQPNEFNSQLLECNLVETKKKIFFFFKLNHINRHILNQQISICTYFLHFVMIFLWQRYSSNGVGLQYDDSVMCELCTKLSQAIRNIAHDKHMEQHIEDVVAKICSAIRFEDLKETCQAEAHQLVSEILNALDANLNCKQVCITRTSALESINSILFGRVFNFDQENDITPKQPIAPKNEYCGLCMEIATEIK